MPIECDLFGLDIALFHHTRPLRQFLLEQCIEFSGAGAGGLHAEFGEAFFHIGALHDGAQVLVHFVDDGGGRFGWQEEGQPNGGHVAWYTLFTDGGQVR